MSDIELLNGFDVVTLQRSPLGDNRPFSWIWRDMGMSFKSHACKIFDDGTHLPSSYMKSDDGVHNSDLR